MANLIKCGDCGAKISPRAATCPKCGAPVPPPPSAASPKAKSNSTLKLVAVLIGLYALMKLIGGGGQSSARTAAFSPAAAPASSTERTLTLRESEFGAAWPYTVPELTFHCDRNPNVPTMLYDVATFNGKTYSFDGLAQSFAARKGYHPMEEIWKDNPDIGGTKMPIFDIVKRTGGLCTGKQ